MVVLPLRPPLAPRAQCRDTTGTRAPLHLRCRKRPPGRGTNLAPNTGLKADERRYLATTQEQRCFGSDDVVVLCTRCKCWPQRRHNHREYFGSLTPAASTACAAHTMPRHHRDQSTAAPPLQQAPFGSRHKAGLKAKRRYLATTKNSGASVRMTSWCCVPGAGDGRSGRKTTDNVSVVLRPLGAPLAPGTQHPTDPQHHYTSAAASILLRRIDQRRWASASMPTNRQVQEPTT